MVAWLCFVNNIVPIKVNPGAQQADEEKVYWSESHPCHWLSLLESPPKRSIFLSFVVSERCQNDIGKNCCCQSHLYGQMNPCHMPGGSQDSLGQMYIKSMSFPKEVTITWTLSFTDGLRFINGTITHGLNTQINTYSIFTQMNKISLLRIWSYFLFNWHGPWMVFCLGVWLLSLHMFMCKLLLRCKLS